MIAIHSNQSELLRGFKLLMFLSDSDVLFHPEKPAGVLVHSLSRQILVPIIALDLISESIAPTKEEGF